MIHYLISFLQDKVQFGHQLENLFSYISVRSSLAIIISLFVTAYFGKYIINILRDKSVGENIRELGLSGEKDKRGTPTMGGLIILLGILIPTFLLNKYDLCE